LDEGWRGEGISLTWGDTLNAINGLSAEGSFFGSMGISLNGWMITG
jgi:hypothetical protein